LLCATTRACSRKFDKNVAAAAAASKKQKGAAAEEAGGKPVVKGKIQVGEFVEVKWGVDWWHAQVNSPETLFPQCSVRAAADTQGSHFESVRETHPLAFIFRRGLSGEGKVAVRENAETKPQTAGDQAG
jgi:hypothetical protein